MAKKICAERRVYRMPKKTQFRLSTIEHLLSPNVVKYILAHEEVWLAKALSPDECCDEISKALSQSVKREQFLLAVVHECRVYGKTRLKPKYPSNKQPMLTEQQWDNLRNLVSKNMQTIKDWGLDCASAIRHLRRFRSVSVELILRLPKRYHFC